MRVFVLAGAFVLMCMYERERRREGEREGGREREREGGRERVKEGEREHSV